jgi:S-disulfanyl-L-cysteine oxidoreductase SoxD
MNKILVATAAALLLGMDAHAAEPPSKTINDGVFTDAQASRGEGEYLRNCSSLCHGSDMKGNERAPSLAGDSFLQRWRGTTVEDLLQRIESTMPQTRPGSLKPETYLDIIAFILQSNGLPSGASELKNDPEDLKHLRM